MSNIGGKKAAKQSTIIQDYAIENPSLIDLLMF